MPTYVYRCEHCGTTFEELQTISAHDDAHPICPRCGNSKVTGLLSVFYAKTSKKS